MIGLLRSARSAALAAAVLSLSAPVALPASVPVARAAAPGSVTVAGSLQNELGCPGDWQPDCSATHMTYDADDNAWQAVFTPGAGNYQYKAALNDSWDENYGAGAVLNGPEIALAAPAGPVRFYYDPDSHWITDSVNSRIVTVPGSFQSELGCSGDWQSDCLRSWLEDPDGDGTYTRTFSLPANVYEAKAAIDESWTENYGAGGVADGDNIEFVVPTDGLAVRMSFVSATNVLTIEVLDITAPTTADVHVGLRAGGRIGSVPIEVTWTVSDDLSGPGTISHEVQVRRWRHGAPGKWKAFAAGVGGQSASGSIALWRKFQFRVRSRDAGGQESEWALSNTIRAWRRQERSFSLGSSWQIAATSGAMRAKTAISSTAGARVSAHFEGRAAAAVMPTGRGLGTARVCIDPGTATADCRTVDLASYTPTGNRLLVVAFNDLVPGRHVLRVEVVSGTVKLDGAVYTR